MKYSIATFLLMGSIFLCAAGQSSPAPEDGALIGTSENYSSISAKLHALEGERRIRILRAIEALKAFEKKSERGASYSSEIVAISVYLESVHAVEAVPAIMDFIDYREMVMSSSSYPIDASMILSLSSMGRPATTEAILRLGTDKSSSKTPMFLRVIYLVEGPDVGRFMLDLAARNEKDPEKKARLQKDMELFANADKPIPA